MYKLIVLLIKILKIKGNYLFKNIFILVIILSVPVERVVKEHYFYEHKFIYTVILIIILKSCVKYL